jgi:hypothetical protein
MELGLGLSWQIILVIDLLLIYIFKLRSRSQFHFPFFVAASICNIKAICKQIINLKKDSIKNM